MSEIPERIEREMFEIRSRLAPDVRDLKKHIEPQAVTKRVTTKIRDRVKGAVTRFGRGLLDSAKRQVDSAREAGRKRDPSAFTDAVKSDPKPLALLAIVLAVTLLMARKITNGKGD
jgi:hypothetical protein